MKQSFSPLLPFRCYTYAKVQHAQQVETTFQRYTVRARLIRPPCQETFIKELAHALHSEKQIIFDLAQSFSKPLDFVLFRLFHAFCPLFSGYRAGSHLFCDLAQNSAHPSKMCARTLHTLLAIELVGESTARVWYLDSLRFPDPKVIKPKLEEHNQLVKLGQSSAVLSGL